MSPRYHAKQHAQLIEREGGSNHKNVLKLPITFKVSILAVKSVQKFRSNRFAPARGIAQRRYNTANVSEIIVLKSLKVNF